MLTLLIAAYVAWCLGVRWERRRVLAEAGERVVEARRADGRALGEGLKASAELDALEKSHATPWAAAEARRAVARHREACQQSAERLRDALAAYDAAADRAELSPVLPWRRRNEALRAWLRRAKGGRNG